MYGVSFPTVKVPLLPIYCFTSKDSQDDDSLLIQVALALISNHKSTDMQVEEHQGHVSSSQLRGIEILQCLLLFGDNNYLGSVFFFLVEKLINLSRQTISKKPS